MTERLEAHFENRIYYFTVESHIDNELKIIMYSTNYTFHKKDEVWENAPGNRMVMDRGLIASVVKAITEKQ